MGEWKCEYCDKTFERKQNYDRHCKTKYHLRRVSREKSVPESSPSSKPETKNDVNLELLTMIKQLQSEIKELKERPVSPQHHSPFSMAPVPNKKYNVNDILSRQGTMLSVPEEKWKTFINTAYYSKCESTIIECSSPHIQKAANLLLGKIENTKPEQLPILIVNKKSGSEKKVAYYEGGYNFILRSGITKKTNVQLYNALDIYLSRSVGQLWYEPKLKEIYRTLPIEVRNKIHYRGGDNKIGFLDFLCLEKKEKSQKTNCNHYGCWNAKLFDGYSNHTEEVFWKWRNRQLINVDNGKFTLDDERFCELRNEFANHVMNHEYYDDYVAFRQNQVDCFFSTETSAIQADVLEELFIQVCRLCNVNEILKLN